MKKIIFSLVIVLMLVMMALLAANLPPIDAETEALRLECDIGPTTIKVGHEIDCRAAAGGGVQPYSWLWTVDGEPVASFQNITYTHITHTFNESGIYNVCINVTDSLDNKRQCCTPITVTGDLNLTCDVSPNPTKVGHETNFTVTASGGVSPYSYFWDFGDGVGSSTDEDPTYIYTTYGDYNVCVNVTDSLDNKGLCCTPVTVNPPLSLECDISPNPTEVGQITNFYSAASGGVPPYFWSWTVNGEEVATDQNTTHIFTVGGTYNVSITVTDSLGNVESCPTLVTVTCGLPTAEFSGSPRSDCAPLTVVFTDLSTGATSWSWDVDGDGNEDYNTQNPSHIYTSPGTYTVSLNVSNACGSGTETKTGYITAKDCAPSPPPSGGGGGGGSCPAIKYLTVDWDGKITKKPLNTNNRLAVDLLGPNPDGSHSLLLERGTLAPTVNGEQHYLIVIRELEEIPPLPENTMAFVVINATPDGAVFDRDIFLTLGFDHLPENALSATIAYYNDVSGVWVPLESEPGGPPNSVAQLSLSAPINHFSIFGVLVEFAPTPTPPAPAHFVPSGLSIVPSVERIWESVTFVTKTGESVTITANVLNDGGEEGTYTVELKLNGETVDTEIVTLGAGQSQPVSFTISGLDYGQYEVEVAGLSGDFRTSRTITWWLIVVIIVVIGLIIWGMVWERRGGRRPTPTPTPTQEG
jgi:PKD repeat protein